MQSAINIKKMEQNRNALIFIDKIEKENDIDKKIKLFIDMMTYYDGINARNFQLFCMDLITDSSIYSRDCKLRDKIIELDSICQQLSIPQSKE